MSPICLRWPRKRKRRHSEAQALEVGCIYRIGPGNIRLIHLASWLLLLLAILHCLFNLLAPLPPIPVLSILALKLSSAAFVWHPSQAVVFTAFCCLYSLCC